MAPSALHDAPIRLAGRTLRTSRHVCAFFHSKEERDRVLMPFFKEGIERGEKAFHIIDGRDREAHLASCCDCGIDVESSQANGQLEVRQWEDAYLKDGYFDGDRMIDVLQQVVEENRPKYGLTRLMGHMEWSLEALPGVSDIVEYETKINLIANNFPDPIVCVYDLNKHSGNVVMDILRTHPMVIVGGVLQENPLFVEPEVLLEELKSRKAPAAVA